MVNTSLENKTHKYFIDNELVLTITEIGNDTYEAENKFTKITGIIKPINEYETLLTLVENKKKDKRGYWRNNKRLADHNLSWLNYILQEKGIIRKSKAIR